MKIVMGISAIRQRADRKKIYEEVVTILPAGKIEGIVCARAGDRVALETEDGNIFIFETDKLKKALSCF